MNDSHAMAVERVIRKAAQAKKRRFIKKSGLPWWKFFGDIVHGKRALENRLLSLGHHKADAKTKHLPLKLKHCTGNEPLVKNILEESRISPPGVKLRLTIQNSPSEKSPKPQNALNGVLRPLNNTNVPISKATGKLVSRNAVPKQLNMNELCSPLEGHGEEPLRAPCGVLCSAARSSYSYSTISGHFAGNPECFLLPFVRVNRLPDELVASYLAEADTATQWGKRKQMKSTRCSDTDSPGSSSLRTKSSENNEERRSLSSGLDSAIVRPEEDLPSCVMQLPSALGAEDPSPRGTSETTLPSTETRVGISGGATADAARDAPGPQGCGLSDLSLSLGRDAPPAKGTQKRRRKVRRGETRVEQSCTPTPRARVQEPASGACGSPEPQGPLSDSVFRLPKPKPSARLTSTEISQRRQLQYAQLSPELRTPRKAPSPECGAAGEERRGKRRRIFSGEDGGTASAGPSGSRSDEYEFDPTPAPPVLPFTHRESPQAARSPPLTCGGGSTTGTAAQLHPQGCAPSSFGGHPAPPMASAAGEPPWEDGAGGEGGAGAAPSGLEAATGVGDGSWMWSFAGEPAEAEEYSCGWCGLEFQSLRELDLHALAHAEPEEGEREWEGQEQEGVEGGHVAEGVGSPAEGVDTLAEPVDTLAEPVGTLAEGVDTLAEPVGTLAEIEDIVDKYVAVSAPSATESVVKDELVLDADVCPGPAPETVVADASLKSADEAEGVNVIDVGIEDLDWDVNVIDVGIEDVEEELARELAIERETARTKMDVFPVRKEDVGEEVEVRRDVDVGAGPEVWTGVDAGVARPAAVPNRKKKKQVQEPLLAGAVGPVAHQSGESLQLLTCPSCPSASPSRFLSASRLRAHRLTEHAEERVVACPPCGYWADSAHRLEHHRALAHLLPRFQCERCSERFLTRDLLRDHQYVKHLDLSRRLACPACKVSLGAPSALTKHIRRHHAGHLPYPCACGQCFGRLADLRKHVREHERALQRLHCTVCFGWFPTGELLRAHMARTHADRLPHACRVCSARFRTLSQLSRHHVQCHPDCWSYLCLGCGAHFVSPANFFGHLVSSGHMVQQSPPIGKCRHCCFCSLDHMEVAEHEETHHSQVLSLERVVQLFSLLDEVNVKSNP